MTSKTAPAHPAPSSGLPGADRLKFSRGRDYWTTHAEPETGLRALRLADGPHGLRVQDDENPDHLGLERSAPATCFPPAVTLASSWDEALIESVGAALAREARASGVDVVLGPGLNLKRSPLCGRNFEYYAEDPLLSGRLAGASARGIQSQGVGACLKHFAANNQETDRNRISADMDERTLREIYLRNFQIALESSGAWSIMTSYNRINGTHVSQDARLMSDILRGEWGFDGLIISDWGGVYDPPAALMAGMDLRMPGGPVGPVLEAALAEGRVTPDRLDEVVATLRQLAERTAPGDTPAPDPQAHHALVRRAAAESTVLLKNDGILPLAPQPGQRFALLGELARTPRIQGAGSSRVNARQVSPVLGTLDARLEAAGASTGFAPGYGLEPGPADPALLAEAVQLAEGADVVLLVLGLTDAAEAEGSDRSHIDLPEQQLALLAALDEARRAGTLRAPVVVSLVNGAVVTTAQWRDGAAAIVEFWLTGQAQGESISDVLLGDTAPGGRLTETIPRRLKDSPAYLDFAGAHQHAPYSEGIFVGYRYYDARDIAVDYPFGHGLSYTSFAYEDLHLEVCDPQDEIALRARLTLRNTGERAGSEVVQLYVSAPGNGFVTPPQELRGWQKLHLSPGEARTVEVAVPRRHLAHWHSELARWIFPGGALEVRIGASSRDIRLSATCTVPGEALPVVLGPWSLFGDWMEHPVMGPRIRALFAARGGVKGRAGDLLNDPAGRNSIYSTPFAMLTEFPGIPMTHEELAALVAEGDALNG
ncbi:glycoside hydrolase family 3 C-terminal domain-containing protein [Pseudooceanicola sp. CBS1P-1]|uniref:Glycosyl hydrolase n=1 Tax=Pseudooceanicola albus TaxID=2692189 RepID=A0A6L7G114_9RHOB|nr:MULTISPECIES: glycoside hydrolase family 3 C-terminal domain-containing protein [Pseudooceanicola]MBT9383536.1 glycoside hydrolase family 3 C-terminal domain-containing protein [Pseudooceanicola endophyticus]MXN17392.1 glycosyl hydrolase [Pseudooceanicola albus]